MIHDRYSNNLKFSHKINRSNDNLGILNQKPIIITKSEAFTFNYADPEKLKYAQLLAKRDIQALKSVETPKEEVQPVIETVRPCKKATTKATSSKLVAKKKSEERVTSIKRVPGPQTPSRVDPPVRERPSILKTSEMPARSMSPPVRDTDVNWQPHSSVERLQRQVGSCTSRLDQLERTLATASIPGKDMRVLEEKLRSLVKPPISHRPPSVTSITAPPPQTLAVPFELVLGRLDFLASQMDAIKARWRSLPYETVSECGELDRFTRMACKPQEEAVPEEDHRLTLDVPRGTVMRLEADRRKFQEAVSMPRLQEAQVAPSRAADWFAEDIVNEALDEIIQEFDDTSAQLVEAILNEELTE